MKTSYGVAASFKISVLPKLPIMTFHLPPALWLSPGEQMQQQELAQMRQRDANLTALAAIGPRKKRKMDSPGPGTPGEVGMLFVMFRCRCGQLRHLLHIAAVVA